MTILTLVNHAYDLVDRALDLVNGPLDLVNRVYDIYIYSKLCLRFTLKHVCDKEVEQNYFSYLALTGVVAMDLLGLLQGWQFFDHAGHLSGVLFAG